MEFTEADIEQIKEKGISLEQVQDQVAIFNRGNVPVNIDAAATVGNGIMQFTAEEKEELISLFDSRRDEGKIDIQKFVPASGAATRMFKAFHEFLGEFDTGKETLSNYLERTDNTIVKKFFENLEKFPFYNRALNNSRESQPGFDSLTEDAKKYILLQTILFSPGLNLSNSPKGLVPFHNYTNFVATAFEEHLYEAANYASVNGVANLHFTVSPGHKEKFEAEYDQIKSRVEETTNVKFEISYSYQNPETDTIAVDENNEPFRTGNGELFFRPGGHGALIENLNNQTADLVFIKNIDNVVVSNNAEQVAKCKKMLGGKLLQLQAESFSFLEALDKNSQDTSLINKTKRFIEEKLFYAFTSGFEKLPEPEKLEEIKNRLNRPLRVCGMVKNEGEPGGGPFLVNMEDGSKSLQIIEGAQIDERDTQQQEIAQNATHFNPVDIVAGINNYKGEPFDLAAYVDPNTSFIANKTKDGKPLKALELPGLWNGAMAKWNTIFIEVPVETFNPVKTVIDLLKPSHQVQ